MALGLGGLGATLATVLVLALGRGPYTGAAPRPRPAETPESTTSEDDAPRRPVVTPSGSASARPPAIPSAWPLLQPLLEDSPPPKRDVEPEVVRAAQAKLDDAMRKRNTLGAFTAMKELVALDPALLADKTVRAHAVTLSQTIALIQGPEPAQFLELMTKDAAPWGLDVLFEILTTRGSSRAAKDAALFLADPEVRKRGSRALQIAWEMRSAEACDAKRPLLARAAAEGDHRVLTDLLMAQQSCRRGGKCCGWKDDDVTATIRALREKAKQ